MGLQDFVPMTLDERGRYADLFQAGALMHAELADVYARVSARMGAQGDVEACELWARASRACSNLHAVASGQAAIVAVGGSTHELDEPVPTLRVVPGRVSVEQSIHDE